LCMDDVPWKLPQLFYFTSFHDSTAKQFNYGLKNEISRSKNEF
jgi:hypothetical protein